MATLRLAGMGEAKRIKDSSTAARSPFPAGKVKGISD